MPAAKEEQTKKITITEYINVFFQKNRKAILIGFIAVMVLIVALVAGITVKDNLQQKALSKVDGFNRRYLELKEFINSTDAESLSKHTDLVVLMVEIDDFAGKNSGFPAARAYSLSADILTEQKNWEEAEKSYLNAAKAAGKSYFAPVSFFNAAAAAEEQGNAEAAIDHYKKALDFEKSFAASARAQFSIGRLEEERNNKSAALEAYNNVVAKWPNEALWTNLAQNRIIVLAN